MLKFIFSVNVRFFLVISSLVIAVFSLAPAIAGNSFVTLVFLKITLALLFITLIIHSLSIPFEFLNNKYNSNN
jgi:hypothetical protein